MNPSIMATTKDKDSLDDLIGRFGPYDFVGELAQNAIDAQLVLSNREPIEVSTEFTPHELGDEGTFILTVEDRGVGMNRRDILGRLTQIFASGKQDDGRTIGVTGIGFISVFAFEPDTVVVDTGRDGESSRVIFKANARFDRLRWPELVTGTSVRVYKLMRPGDVDDVRELMKSSLAYWCRVSELEVRFNGETIREEFAYQRPISWFSEGLGEITRLAISPALEGSTSYELFRRGFLIEAGSKEDLSFPGIAFRVDSPRICHTLARDGAFRGEGLTALMLEVQAAVNGPYLSFLVEQLAVEPQDAALGVLATRLDLVSRKQLRIPLIPASDGSKLSLLALAGKVQKGEISWTSRQRTDEALPLWDGISPGLGQLLAKINRVSKSRVGQIVNRFRELPDIIPVEVS